MDTLPLTYRASQKAWMTSTLSEEWKKNWDASLRKEGHKILVLVDDCSAHPQNMISTLTNIRLELFPANMMHLIQQMDQGVIKNLNTFYRKEVVQMTIDTIEDRVISPSARATDVSAKVSLLDAVHFVSSSWQQVKAKTIANCFCKAGFERVETNCRADNVSFRKPAGLEVFPEEESTVRTSCKLEG